MPEGLTYDTRSQAETMAEDYHNQGFLTKITRTPDGKFRVLIASGFKPLPEEDLPEMEEVGEEDKIEEEFEKEERREARREAKRLPGTIKKRKLDVKHKELELENEKRVRMGLERGTIIEIRDPETYEVIGYKLRFRELEQRAAESVSKKIPEGIAHAPIALGEFSGGIVEHTSRRMDVKKGMKASIPGQTPMPSAVIAWLPEKDVGAIGARRPAIGTMTSIDTSKIELPTGSPLKTTAKTKKLTANGQGDMGFAKTPGLREPKKE